MKTNIVVLGKLFLPKVLGVEVLRYNLYGLTERTWKRRFNSISKMIKAGQLRGIIIYLPTPLFIQASKDPFFELWKNFISELKGTKTLIIAYQTNINGNFDFYDYQSENYLNLKEINKRLKILEPDLSREYIENFELENEVEEINYKTAKKAQQEAETVEEHLEQYKMYASEREYGRLKKAKERINYYKENKERVEEFIDQILESEIEISAFKDKSEVFIRGEEFLSRLIKGAFFELYVRNDQILFDEFSQFIKIFERYIQKVENKSIWVDTQSTKEGTIFKFRTYDEVSDYSDLTKAIQRFDKFMDLCNNSPNKALEILNKIYPRKDLALQVLEEFTKKYRRLTLDLKHQIERIQLNLKQGFENSIQELTFIENPALMINNSKELSEQLSVIAISDIPFINNDNKFNEDEIKIIELTKKYGREQDIIYINTNIQQVRDIQLTEPERKSAAQKIKSYLFKIGRKVANKAEDLAIKALIEYIEKQIK